MDFEKFSDEELCKRAKEGDKEAENYLLNKYKNLVRGKAKTLYLLGGDREDLIQEGMIGLFVAVRDFDGSKNASFSTFANLVCERRMYNAIKAGQAGKNLPLNTYVSLYASEDSEEIKLINNLRASSFFEPEGFVIDKENTMFLLEKLSKSLSKLEEEVLDLYLSGKDYKKIADLLERSPKSIDNALVRIKAKFKQVIDSEK
ncbi:MAG: sigma-70 family RNA polymerase sigma factor [Catonella sp.]|uniref:sigma-70 family RNA polymerase sigma factor n=1 Tax=Catonella sp. TaxID=2382125 RepID=UPI003FA150BD